MGICSIGGRRWLFALTCILGSAAACTVQAGFQARLWFENQTKGTSNSGPLLAEAGDRIAIRFSFTGDTGNDKWAVLQFMIALDGIRAISEQEGNSFIGQAAASFLSGSSFPSKLFWQLNSGAIHDNGLDPGDVTAALIANRGLYLRVTVDQNNPQASNFTATIFRFTVQPGSSGQQVRWTYEGRDTTTGISTRIVLPNGATQLVTNNYVQVVGGIPQDWIRNPNNGHLYRTTITRMTWRDARLLAALWGGSLVTVNDAAEQNWLISQFGSAENFHIGLRDVKAGLGKWRWETGEPVNYTNWAPGEPGSSASEPVVQMKAGTNGQWENVSLATTAYGIVERVPGIVETLEVPATGGTVASSPLLNGRTYTVEASGVYVFSGDGGLADAEFWSQGGQNWDQTYSGDRLDLLVNGQSIAWLGSTDGVRFAANTFSPSHVYRTTIVGTGAPVQFRLDDPTPEDNFGGLQVRIYAGVPETGVQADAPWPLTEADRHTTGYLPWAAAPDSYILEWSFPTTGKPLVVSARGDVYCARGNTLEQFTSNGIRQSTLVVGTQDITGAAIGVDGTVYVVCGNESISALSADLSQVYWTQPGGGYCGLTIDRDGNLYYGGWFGDGRIYSRQSNGVLRWSINLLTTLRRGVSIGPDGKVYFSAANGNTVYAVRPDGTHVEMIDAGRPGSLPPVFASDGTAYLTPFDGYFQCFNPNWSLRWEYIIDGAYGAPSVLPNGRVTAAGFMDSALYSFDPDGTLLWLVDQFSMGDERVRTDAVGTAMNVNWTHTIWAVDYLGETLFTADFDGTRIPQSHIMGADGTIYVNMDSTLMAIGPGVPVPQETFVVINDLLSQAGATVTLQARLALARNGGGLSGRPVQFKVGGVTVGNTSTDWRGIASLNYTIPAQTESGPITIEAIAASDDRAWGSSASGKLWVTPKLSTVSGIVELQFYFASRAGVPIAFEVLDGQTVVARATGVLNSVGLYTIAVPVKGTYSLRAKGPTWLSHRVDGVVFDPDTPALSSYSLINGDADGDNVVGLGDLNVILLNFQKSGTAPGDLDGSRQVDLTDVTIALLSFAKSGT